MVALQVIHGHIQGHVLGLNMLDLGSVGLDHREELVQLGGQELHIGACIPH